MRAPLDWLPAPKLGPWDLTSVLGWTVGVLALAAPLSAQPSEMSGRLRQRHSDQRRPVTCAVDAQGRFGDDTRLDLSVQVRGSDASGHFRLKDKDLHLKFRASSMSSVVVADGVASVQGLGWLRDAGDVAFSATIETATRTVSVRLANGYYASGSLDQHPLRVSGACPFDGVVEPMLDAPGRVTATIGPAGGTIVAGGATLTVPAGALSEPVAITMTPILDLAGSPLQSTVVGGARFEPDGLAFLRPAQLVLPRPPTLDVASLYGFGVTHDGSELFLQPVSVGQGVITVPVWHFSGAGAAATGAAGAAAATTHTPSTAERRALARIALVRPACVAELDAGVVGGPACDRYAQEAVRAYFEWYIDGVRPGLEAAGQAADSTVPAAITEWLSWAGELRTFFFELTQDAAIDCGQLQSECNQAQALANEAVTALALRRLQACTGTDLLAELRGVVLLTGVFQAGGITPTDARVPAEIPNVMRECASVEVSLVELSAVLASGRPNRLALRAALKTFTDAILTSLPIDLTLRFRAGGVGFDQSRATLTGETFETNAYVTGTHTSIEALAAVQPASFPGLDPTILEHLGSSAEYPRDVRARVELETLAPVDALLPGRSVPLRARIAGDDIGGATITYRVDGPGVLSSPSGLANSNGEAPTFSLTIPTGSAPGPVTVTATFDGDTASVSGAVVDDVTLDIAPSALVIGAGQSALVTAVVTGTPNTAVTWSATGGSISPGPSDTATYTAGNVTGTFSITATSVANPAVSRTIPVTVVAQPTLEGTYLGPWSSTGEFHNSAPNGRAQISRVSGGLVLEFRLTSTGPRFATFPLQVNGASFSGSMDDGNNQRTVSGSLTGSTLHLTIDSRFGFTCGPDGTSLCFTVITFAGVRQ